MAYQPGHPSREKPASFVRAMFAAHGWAFREHGGQPGALYNAGQSKNAGVRSWPGDPDDVFVLADCDCVTSRETLRELVWLAHSAPGLVGCGTYLRILGPEDIAHYQSWEEAALGLRGVVRPVDAPAQLLAIRRECFEQVGGYDERYIGYGFEDYDFRERCEKLWPFRQATGTLVHLWHEPDEQKVTRGDLYETNRQRWIASGGVMWNE